MSDRGKDAEDDCPLCLEPLPPFWDTVRRVTAICCGKTVCVGCHNKRDAYLQTARAEGTFGRQEEQLNNCCPWCRGQKPTADDVGRMRLDKFEKGQLPLKIYRMLGMDFIQGQGGVEMNVERGVEILMLGANKGDPNCQYSLGVRYHEGKDGLRKSPKEAKRWYLAATEQGHAKAENNLACITEEEGNGAEYLRYTRSSASKGYDVACYGLGRAYYYGERGLQKSSDDSIRAVTPAAERGNALSMSLLGYAMCQPDPQLPPPLPQNNLNFTKGVHWMRRAAETGDHQSVSNLKSMENYAGSKCFRCNKEAPPEQTFLRCSRCRAAWYCSKDCQVQHWRADAGHKQFCIMWKTVQLVQHSQ